MDIGSHGGQGFVCSSMENLPFPESDKSKHLRSMWESIKITQRNKG